MRDTRNLVLMVRYDDPALQGLRRTDRDCPACENGILLRDDSELLCDTCQYTPDPRENMGRNADDPWERFRALREQARDDGDRPYCVGGVPDAYWGSAAYEYDPTDGFQIPR